MKREGHNAEFCELCTQFLTAGDPRKGCHGEQTAFFGREAQSNFSLLPMNLWLGESHSIQQQLGTAASLATALGQLLPEDTSCFLETRPFLLGTRNGGE